MSNQIKWDGIHFSLQGLSQKTDLNLIQKITNQSILQSIGHSMASGLKDSAFKQINTRFFTKKLIILPRNFNFHGSDNKNGWNRDRSRLLKSKWGNFQIIYLQKCDGIKVYMNPPFWSCQNMISFSLLIWILKHIVLN